MSIQRRIARLEVAVQPAAPSWTEYYAASERTSARIRRALRTAVETECALTTSQIDEEAGPPYLWRCANIEEETRLLAGYMDTPQQEQQDQEVMARYDHAHGFGGNMQVNDAELENLIGQLQRLIEQLTGRKTTQEDGCKVIYRMFGRKPKGLE